MGFRVWRRNSIKNYSLTFQFEVDRLQIMGVGKTRDGRTSVTVKMGKTRDGTVRDIYVTDP